MNKKPELQKAKYLDDNDYFRSEVNFSVFPIFSLSRQGRNLNKYEYVVYKNKSTKASMVVTSNAHYKFPTAFDYKVFKTIEYIISSKNPIKNPVPVSLYRICRLMNITIQNSANIKNSIKRLCLTGIETKGMFHQKGSSVQLEDTFTIYSRAIFRNELLPSGDRANSTYIYLSEPYFSNLKSNYIRYINYDFFINLKSDISKRLYDLFTLKFYGMSGKYLNYSYENLCKILLIKEHSKFSYVKRTMEPAFNELIEAEFFQNVLYKKSHNKLYLFFYPGKRYYAEKKFISSNKIIPLPIIEKDPQRDKIIRAFVERGLTSADIIISSDKNKRTNEELEIIIKDYDKRKNGISNPPAWFNAVITSDSFNRPANIYTFKEENKLKEKQIYLDSFNKLIIDISNLNDDIKQINHTLNTSSQKQHLHFCRNEFFNRHGRIIFKLSEFPSEFLSEIKSNVNLYLESLQKNKISLTKKLEDLKAQYKNMKLKIDNLQQSNE